MRERGGGNKEDNDNILMQASMVTTLSDQETISV